MNGFAVLGGAYGLKLQALLATAVAEWEVAGLHVAGGVAEAHTLPGRT